MKYFFQILFVLNFGTIIFSQVDEKIEENVYVKDSSTYNGKKIFIFSDGSWEYESEFKVVDVVRSVLLDGVVSFDVNELYVANWKNHKTHIKVENLAGLLDTVYFDISNVYKPVSQNCNSSFKIRSGRWHLGNDFAAPIGTEIHSVWDGKVRYAEMNGGGYGNLVIIRHSNGLETYYAHLSKITVKINDVISANQVIGLVGNTGHSSGPHLHFETRILGNPFDPSLIFKGEKLLVCSKTFPTNDQNCRKIKSSEIFNFSKESISSVGIVRTRTKRKTASNLGE